MGARGPLKITPHLQIVDVAGTAAAEVQPQAPEKPQAVTENPELSAIWDEIVEVLEADGLLARSDVLALEMACRHFWLARRASEAAGKQLVIADTAHGGEKKNPAEAICRAESAMFLRYASTLGLTFASRARTPATSPKGGDDGAEENPFAAPGSLG